MKHDACTHASTSAARSKCRKAHTVGTPVRHTVHWAIVTPGREGVHTKTFLTWEEARDWAYANLSLNTQGLLPNASDLNRNGVGPFGDSLFNGEYYESGVFDNVNCVAIITCNVHHDFRW